jgi:uncharacterized protein with WD repeat
MSRYEIQLRELLQTERVVEHVKEDRYSIEEQEVLQLKPIKQLENNDMHEEPTCDRLSENLLEHNIFE